MAGADKDNPTAANQQNLNPNTIPADWLLLGLSNEVGYGVMLQMPKALAKSIVPSSITFDIDLALLSNSRLTESGHEVEIRGLIDKFLRNNDIEALRSLVLSAHLEKTEVDPN
ncbi:MAG: hypothetical protein ACJA2Q_002646 [Pseudohongiellaceae bacterium]|jgi:hypothetical protein